MLRRLLVLSLLASGLGAVELRVATFNVGTQFNEDWWPSFSLGDPGTVDHDTVVAILDRIDADVVALQEVHTSDTTGTPLSELEQLAATLGYPHIHIGSNSGNFDPNLRVIVLSRYPFISSESIVSPPGAKEISRHPVAVVVDVPGTDADPLVIAAHLKSGGGLDDRFRRAVEMKRIVDHLESSGFGAADNFIILGDFNPSGIDSTFTGIRSSLPSTYSLGSDVTFPLNYYGDLTSYFGSPLPTMLDPLQLDGSSATFDSGSRLDFLLVSPGLAGRPYQTEIYNSALDTANGQGMDKVGSPLASDTSALASDHYAIFGDFELDQEAFNLALAASAGSVSEADPEGTVMLTVSLAEPAAMPVTLSLSSDDSAAVPVDTSLLIAMGGTTASTAVRTSRNFLVDGTRTVNFTVTATGYAQAVTSVQVVDADSGYVFTQAGETIVEDFDGFGGSHAPAPWTASTGVWIGLDDGSSAVAGGRSFGSLGEGSAGFVSEGADLVLETDYTNGSSEPLTILDLAYDAEQWRSSLGGAADSIEVELEVGGQVIPIPALSFDARTDLPDGPVAGGSPVMFSTRLGGLAVAPGGGFTLRFRFDADDNSAPLPDDVFINEFHYDNDGPDQGEFVEVVVGSGFPGAIANLEVVCYNGSTPGAATIYRTLNLATDFTEGNPSGDYRFFVADLPSNGLQNGGNDGFALVDTSASEVLQLISYEGEFTAGDGLAVGMTSSDVGVTESNSDPVGGSLGMVGTGGSAGDFSWAAFGSASKGEPNPGQSLVSPGVPSQGIAIDNVVVGFVEDTDGDGIANDTDPDDDNDGMSDDDELAFGTDPEDAGSRFDLRVIQGGAGPELSFPGAEGILYTIEWCDDLVSWDQSATIEGQGAQITFPLPVGEERVFVRVRAGE